MDALRFKKLRGGDGWLQVPEIKDDQSLLNLAASLGNIRGREIARLMPREGLSAKGRSLSSAHGFGEFPLHTDAAFWRIPARYMVMRAEQPSAVATKILTAGVVTRVITASGGNPIFSIRTKKASFYSSLKFSSESGSEGIRFDLGHMKPANSAAKILVDALTQAGDECLNLPWDGESALIIDNWACLHGRCSVGVGDRDRSLSRIYVGGEEG